MEHFNIILGLCRSALQGGNPAIEKHIKRLIKALDKSGDADNSVALANLVAGQRSKKGAELSPSRVVMSRASVAGEILTPSVNPPVDKETGAPLAEIMLPSQFGRVTPIFNSQLEGGVARLLAEWRNADKLTAKGIDPALTSMLFGAPGTGKTMLAHFIAKELELPLVVARLDGLISSFLGTTARNISNLFSFANRYKCILLLDEFDAVAKLRDDPHELGEIKRVVNTLLQCIDSRTKSGYTIAITNHESLLDPAVWRRFDIRIDIGLPEFATRVAILERLFDSSAITDEQIHFLAWLSRDGSGSDLTKLYNFLARQQAILESNFDFLEAVRTFILLSASEDKNNSRKLALSSPEVLARELANDDDFAWGQEQIANLFDSSQSTVSRWLKKPKKAIEVTS